MKTFAIGEVVRCPEDRGDASYMAKVTHVSDVPHENIHGMKYVWVTVATMDTKSRHVWPSHRLLKLPSAKESMS